MSRFDLNQGALAPLADEVDEVNLEVDGEIPVDLNGVLLRNGPNPFNGRFEGHDVLSWWPAAAMFHALYFENGKVMRYRNRWARTRQWAAYHGSDYTGDGVDSNPNVNFVHHAGELLALGESAKPVVINTKLESLGESRQRGLNRGMAAHPKKDPLTGELITFRTDWNQPWLSYGVTNAGGDEVFATDIDVASPMMMHDMAITPTHSIFFDLGVAYDFSLLQQGFTIPLRWHNDRECRIGVMPRYGGKVQWVSIAPCFIQHIANAYNHNDHTVIVDAVRYPWYLRVSTESNRFEANPLGVLWRYTIDLQTGDVTETAIDDRGIEFPRINESLTGQPYRYMYAVSQPTNEEIRGVVKYHVQSGEMQHYDVPLGDQNGEPVFVPKQNASSDDDGWLLIYVYRRNTDTSDLIILDANDIERGECATVHLKSRVPAGFHAAWIPHH